jgi:hypothetical protein
MSCLGGCLNKQNLYKNITNRTTGVPIRFNSNELE